MRNTTTFTCSPEVSAKQQPSTQPRPKCAATVKYCYLLRYAIYITTAPLCCSFSAAVRTTMTHCDSGTDRSAGCSTAYRRRPLTAAPSSTLKRDIACGAMQATASPACNSHLHLTFGQPVYMHNCRRFAAVVNSDDAPMSRFVSLALLAASATGSCRTLLVADKAKAQPCTHNTKHCGPCIGIEFRDDVCSTSRVDLIAQVFSLWQQEMRLQYMQSQ